VNRAPVIAVIGENDPAPEIIRLSEIAFARIEGTAVIGLRTWELRRDGFADPAIQPAVDPKEAVQLALEAARRRPT